MQKKIRLLMGLALSTTIITGCSNTGNLSGAVLDEITEGTGEYTWRKNEVHIELNAPRASKNEFPSNENDYITNVLYFTSYSLPISDSRTNGVAYISYDQSFNWADDLEVFFVIADGDLSYTTEIVHTDLPWFTEQITVQYPGMTDNSFIKEIWIKTVD